MRLTLVARIAASCFALTVIAVGLGFLLRDAVDHRATLRAALVVLLITCVALSASLSLARGVTGPLGRLTDHVSRLSRGSRKPSADRAPREVMVLAQVIERLRARDRKDRDRIEAEAVLRERILSALEDGVILAEARAVIYTNRAARDLLGIEELQVLPPTLPVASDEPVVGEVTLHHPTFREIRVVASPLPGGRTLLLLTDVTETKRVEAMRRDFVANASHELKTPVAAILATSETLQDAITEDRDAAVRFSDTLRKEAERLASMVKDLLDLARLEQEVETGDSVALNAIAEEVIRSIEPEASAKRITIERHLQPAVILHGSRADLALMVRNLLDNAIRYTPEDGTVSISVGDRGTTAMLVVKDDGIGIPEKDLRRIFERFYRVDKARSRDTGGTGLGLAIVKHVAERMGGTVTAESELGVGSTFTVVLPRK